LRKIFQNWQEIPKAFQKWQEKINPTRVQIPRSACSCTQTKSQKISQNYSNYRASKYPLRTRFYAPFDIAQTRAKFVCPISFSACPKTSLFLSPKIELAPRFWRAGSELQEFFSRADKKFLKISWRTTSDKYTHLHFIKLAES